MRISVRQLKGLIREAIDEAQKAQKSSNNVVTRSSKNMYVLFAGRGRNTLVGVFASEADAKAASE